LIVVSDAGALIDLADAECLDILHRIFEEVIIPIEVFAEVFQRRQRVKPKWIKICSADKPENLECFTKMRLAVDDGEAAAIAVARELDLPVIMEDKAGMLQCERYRVEYFSLYRVLNEKLPPKECSRVIDAVRQRTGKLLCEPEF
jgi:predicted nucleic acid-binding protein